MKIYIFVLFAAVFMQTMSCASKGDESLNGDKLGNNTIFSKTIDSRVKANEYAQKGKFGFDLSEAHLKSNTGCKVKYSYFKSDASAGNQAPTFVVAHGFMRSKKRMKGLAEHITSWGIDVVTIDFCNSKIWHGHHDRNAADMILVVEKLDLKKVIYSGFSAGGLSAFIAASVDKKAQSYFGLDMVDFMKMGMNASENLSVPAFGLVAESSMCNAKNNSFPAYKNLQQDATLVKVQGATHCDFEFPYDKKCALACGFRKKGYDSESVQETILELTTAYLLWQTKGDAAAKAVWDLK